VGERESTGKGWRRVSPMPPTVNRPFFGTETKAQQQKDIHSILEGKGIKGKRGTGGYISERGGGQDVRGGEMAAREKFTIPEESLRVARSDREMLGGGKCRSLRLWCPWYERGKGLESRRT